MPVAVVQNPEFAAGGVVDHPRRKRWTRTELLQLIGEGHTEFERYELFDGELIDKMGKNWPHVSVVHLISLALRRLYGEDRVLQEAPISLRPQDDAVYRPEPDVVVLSQGILQVSGLHEPRPEGILLAIEVADTTLRFDLVSKSVAYSRAGIAEYWVADVTGKQVFVHRNPGPDGYSSIQAYRSGETIHPVTQPDSGIAVDDLFAR
jgi:Uma2 family endonuclease